MRELHATAQTCIYGAIICHEGTDGTGHALTYMTYELAKRPDVWHALRAELSTMPSEEQFDIDILRSLPYFNAFIKVIRARFKTPILPLNQLLCSQEVLRIHGSGNVYIERVVPEEGALLAGYFLPGGTVQKSISHVSLNLMLILITVESWRVGVKFALERVDLPETARVDTRALASMGH